MAPVSPTISVSLSLLLAHAYMCGCALPACSLQGQHWKQAQLFLWHSPWQPNSPAAKGLHTAIPLSPSLVRGILRVHPACPLWPPQLLTCCEGNRDGKGQTCPSPRGCHVGKQHCISQPQSLGYSKKLSGTPSLFWTFTKRIKMATSRGDARKGMQVNWSCLAGEKHHCRDRSLVKGGGLSSSFISELPVRLLDSPFGFKPSICTYLLQCVSKQL